MQTEGQLRRDARAAFDLFRRRTLSDMQQQLRHQIAPQQGHELACHFGRSAIVDKAGIGAVEIEPGVAEFRR